MTKFLLMSVALSGAVWGMVEPDAVFAAFMGGSFGFQLALWLVTHEPKPRTTERVR